VAAAVVQDRVWIVGGLDSNGRATDTVQVWNEAQNKWSTDVPLPVRVHHAMAAELNGKLYVIGGFFDGGEASDQTFILQGGTWKEGPTLRRPRAAAGAVSLRGRIVLVGGVSGPEHVAPVEFTDGSAWRDGAPIPSLRDHVGAATDGSFVYVAGGRRGGEHFATFDRYDLEKDRWVTLRDMPTARSGNGAAFVNGKIVSVGGEGPRIFPEVEAYDIASRSWTRLPDLALPVHGVGVVALGSNVYAFVGGIKVGLAPTRACQVLAIP